MKICEDCIKQDVCKFTEKVSKLRLKDNKLPDPLIPELKCPNKRTEPSNWHYTTVTADTTTGTGDYHGHPTVPCVDNGDDLTWTTGDSPLAPEVIWC